MKRTIALALVVALLLSTRSLALFGIADTGDGVLAGILAENVKQSVDMVAQLENLKTIIETTRENLEFARSVYALSQEINDFDPNLFMQEARMAFMSSHPVFGEASYLANDIARNGLRGGRFNWSAIQHQIDMFNEDKRAGECGCDYEGRPSDPTSMECVFVCRDAHARGYPFKSNRESGPQKPPGPYNEDAASRLGAALDTAVNDKDLRDKLLAAPPDPNTAEAVVFHELASRDPSAGAALLRERAQAARAATQAQELSTSARAKDLNAGSAQAITARSTSLASEQLAAIREANAKQLAMEQGKEAERIKEQKDEQVKMQIHALHMGDLLYLGIRNLGGAGEARNNVPSSDPYSH
jgi:hypothetical protein